MNEKNNLMQCTQCLTMQDINQNICKDCPPTTYIVKGSMAHEAQEIFNKSFAGWLVVSMLVILFVINANGEFIFVYLIGALIGSWLAAFYIKGAYIKNHIKDVRFIRD